jgi:hypothetical protein
MLVLIYAPNHVFFFEILTYKLVKDYYIYWNLGETDKYTTYNFIQLIINDPCVLPYILYTISHLRFSL